MKAFNLERALAGDPVMTRGGNKVSGLIYIESAKDCIFCVAAHVQGERYGLRTFTINGSHCDDGLDSSYDLFMAPVEKTVYFSVYMSPNGNVVPSYKAYNSPEEALAGINHLRTFVGYTKFTYHE